MQHHLARAVIEQLGYADLNQLADQRAGIKSCFILSINDTPGARATFARCNVGTAETAYTIRAGPAQKASELTAW